MMSSKKMALLSFITVFILGVAVGVVLENRVFDKKSRGHKPRDPNDYLFEKFSKELSLTTTQQDTLQMLLDEIKEKHRKLGEKRHEEFENIRAEFDAEFRKILTSEQLTRYDEMVRQFEEKWKNRREKGPQKGDEK